MRAWIAALRAGARGAVSQAPRNLDLALIGNGRIGLLVDAEGTVVWGCFPRFDGDPTFCALLDTAPPAEARGIFAIELADLAHSEQHYVRNTAVLSTRLRDRDGGEIEIVDCVPRHREFDRMHTPHALVRHVRRVAGRPRITRAPAARRRVGRAGVRRRRSAATTSASSRRS